MDGLWEEGHIWLTRFTKTLPCLTPVLSSESGSLPLVDYLHDGVLCLKDRVRGDEESARRPPGPSSPTPPEPRSGAIDLLRLRICPSPPHLRLRSPSGRGGRFGSDLVVTGSHRGGTGPPVSTPAD